MASRLSETKFHTCVRGYHVYQNDWIPALGKVLQCSHENGNAHDPYAVKVMKAGTSWALAEENKLSLFTVY